MLLNPKQQAMPERASRSEFESHLHIALLSAFSLPILNFLASCGPLNVDQAMRGLYRLWSPASLGSAGYQGCLCDVPYHAGYLTQAWLAYSSEPLQVAFLMQVLQRLTFDDSQVSKAMASEARILLFNYWFTYCVLRARRPKFQPLQPPKRQ